METASKTNWVEVPIEAIKKSLDKKGIKYTVIDVPYVKDGKYVYDEAGNKVMHKAVHIDEVPEDEQAAIDFIGDKECWFEGCEELRARYKAEYDKAGGDGGCSSCQKNKIMRKYVELVKKAMREDKARKDERKDTRIEQVPGPGGTGTEGAGEKPSLLRRAASRIKKILRACTE